jgi:protein-disulfide isomerase
MQNETPHVRETHHHADGHTGHDRHEVVHTSHAVRPKKIEFSTPIAILLGAVVIALGLLGHGYLSKGNTSSNSFAYLDSFAGKSPLSDKFVEGKQESKVYFIEYSDTQCPYCVAFHKTVTELRSKYAGKVTFIYRHFPLGFHPHAMPEAVAMNCMGKLGGSKAYYDFMTKLFDFKVANQAEAVDDAFTNSFLAANKIDQSAFTSCKQDPSMKAEVEASIQDGQMAGVSGTPTSFILVKDGDEFKVLKRLEGASQLGFIAPQIEKALK